MIIFYDKRNGRVFSSIDGRVHDKRTMKNIVFDTSVPKEFVEKIIIGWEETEELEEYETEVEAFQELPSGLFEKVKKIKKSKRRKRVPHNMDKFELLQKFEDTTPESPLDYRIDIETNNLIKK